jgi:hypothetical protein
MPYYFANGSYNCNDVIGSQMGMGVFLTGDTITPLQAPVGQSFELVGIKVDLHIVLHTVGDGKRIAHGKLFLEDINDFDGFTFCLVKMDFINDVVTFSKD